jgi:iron complex outermembrane receptor protein
MRRLADINVSHDAGRRNSGETLAIYAASRINQLRTFEKNSLDQAVNIAPGVVSTFDANGRRNESDIFVRGSGSWQVPLMVDGVRIYLPADNRLDFGRFLTADIAAIQIQKGYASVLDGPGAMGGAINLVTMTPTKRFEAEGGLSADGSGPPRRTRTSAQSAPPTSSWAGHGRSAAMLAWPPRCFTAT